MSLCFESHSKITAKGHLLSSTFWEKGKRYAKPSCTTERLTVPPTFCFNFFKHLEEQKRAFDHGKSLTITAGLQRLSSILSLGETLQGLDACMQTESKIERERKREMRQRDGGGERQRHETERWRKWERERGHISWVLCLGGFQQPNKRTNTKKRRIFTSNPVLHPGSISQPNKHPHTQHSEKEGHAQPLCTLKKREKETWTAMISHAHDRMGHRKSYILQPKERGLCNLCWSPAKLMPNKYLF